MPIKSLCSHSQFPIRTRSFRRKRVSPSTNLPSSCPKLFANQAVPGEISAAKEVAELWLLPIGWWSFAPPPLECRPELFVVVILLWFDPIDRKFDSDVLIYEYQLSAMDDWFLRTGSVSLFSSKYNISINNQNLHDKFFDGSDVNKTENGFSFKQWDREVKMLPIRRYHSTTHSLSRKQCCGDF